MNISGIRPSVGFYEQNSIKVNFDLGSMSVEETAPEIAVEESSSVSQVSDDEVAAAREKQTFGSYDFASQYKPGAVHELKGADSDIRTLDVEKAVSDMQKDSAIHRYQYFVQHKGTSQSEPDIYIRGSENFTL